MSPIETSPCGRRRSAESVGAPLADDPDSRLEDLRAADIRSVAGIRA